MIRWELNQEIVPASVRLRDAWLDKLFARVSDHLRLRGAHTLSIAFVDHRTMQRLNRTYRHKDRVTDILSFATVGGPGSLGELVIAWPFVRTQAKKKKKTLLEELALLLIHGVLHLRGYDHEARKDAAKMFPLQDSILSDFLEI